MNRIALLAFALISPMACNKDDGAATTAPVAPPVAATPATAPPGVTAKAPGDPAAALLQMQKVLGASAANNANVKAVSWRDLAPLLADDLDGWKADGEVKGESTSMGAISVSEAKRQYKKDGVTAHVQISDTSMNTMLAAAFNMARLTNVDASDHYQKGIDIAGNPGVEEWRAGGKEGRATMLVGGRFIVEAHANPTTDAKGLVGLVTKLDLSKLAALK